MFSLLILQGCLSHSNHVILIASTDAQAEIPFELESELIILEAEVGGVEGKFLFDNGFSQSALDPEFAIRAGLQFEGKSNLIDFNNNKKSTPHCHVDTTRIEEFLFLDAKFYAVETSQLFPCDTIHGILGGNIINQVNWQIDWKQQRLKVAKEPFTHEGIPIQIKFNRNNETFTNLAISNGPSISCKIDFGSNSSLRLQYDDVIDHLQGLPVEARTGIKSISTHGLGPLQTFYQTVKPLSVSHEDHLLLPVHATISQGLKQSAYIGAPFFKNYLVTINSTLKQYILSPNILPTSQDTSILPTYGVTLYFHDGAWKIINKNDSDPSLDKVTVWEEVVEMDHVPASQYPDLCTWRESLRVKKKTGKPLHIVLAGHRSPITVPYQPPITTPLP